MSVTQSNKPFSSTFLRIYIVCYLLSVISYVFFDDGGITTKYWYDFPTILIVSLFAAAVLSVLPILIIWLSSRLFR